MGIMTFALWVSSKFLGIVGKPTRVCGHALVERLGSKWMWLTDVPEAIMRLVAVA